MNQGPLSISPFRAKMLPLVQGSDSISQMLAGSRITGRCRGAHFKFRCQAHSQSLICCSRERQESAFPAGSLGDATVGSDQRQSEMMHQEKAG